MKSVLYFGVGLATVAAKRSLAIVPTPGQAPSRWCKQSHRNVGDHLAEQHMHRVETVILRNRLNQRALVIAIVA